MRLHYLQHVPFEGIGSMNAWAARKGHSVTRTRLFAREVLPKLSDFDLLVIMGGPMNIYEEDQYPWLKQEKTFIREAISANKTVLGVCLGSQFIADVLGAKVFRNEVKEIGWFPIEMTAEAAKAGPFQGLNAGMEVFHWHGDTFPIPKGAIHIARSKACASQAFIHGDRVIGLQFHLETNRQSAELLIRNCGDELVKGPFIQTPQEMLRDEKRFERINRAMNEMLDALEEVWREG